MNGKEDAQTQKETRPEEPGREIANMDEYDFLTLLLESRIVQYA